jgi:flagellar hook-length control protein FliK
LLKQPIATPSAAFLERPKTVLSTASDPNNPALQLQPTIPPQTLATADERSGLPKQKNGEEGLAALFGGYLPTAYKKTAVAAADKDTGLEATLQAFTDALATLTPTLSTDDVATTGTMDKAAVLTAPAFVKPLPDGIKPDMPSKEAVIANGFLQKETALYPSTPDGQAFNLQNLDNTAPAEKTRALDKQAPILGADKTPAGVVAEMAPPHRQLDNRTDMPAMTRHLSHPGWGKELGEQIVWMNNKAIPAAEIKLNPAHLGPISVRIDVNQDQATIVFTAQHTEVKDAIEASIPKLREMLATQQLNLANVNISQNATSDQGRSQSQPQPQPFFKPPEHQGQGVDSGTDTLEKNEPDRGGVSKGLLSLYA